MTDDAAKAFAAPLNCFFAALFRADADRVGNRFYEYFAVAILSRARLFDDRINYRLAQFIRGDYLDSRTDGQGDQLLFTAEPGSPLLTVARASNFSDRQPRDAGRRDRRFDRLKLVGTNDANDADHGFGSASNSSMIS